VIKMAENKTKKEEKKETKLSKSVEKLVEEIAKLTVIELSQLVSALQEKLGVSTPVATAAVTQPQPTQTAEVAPSGGGATKQTLVMTASGSNKIAVIKALREINQNWTLKEAKDMTEQVPTEVLKDAKADDVKNATDKLKVAGANVEVK